MLWSPLAVVAAYILGATVVNLEMLACGDRQLTQGFYRATNNREDQQASSLSWVGWVVPSMEGPWGLSSLLDMAPSLMSVMFADVLGRNVEWMFGCVGCVFFRNSPAAVTLFGVMFEACV